MFKEFKDGLKEIHEHRKGLITKGAFLESFLIKKFSILFNEKHRIDFVFREIEKELCFYISNQCLRIKSAQIQIPLEGDYESHVNLSGRRLGLFKPYWKDSFRFWRIKRFDRKGDCLSFKYYSRDENSKHAFLRLSVLKNHKDVNQAELRKFYSFLRAYNKIRAGIDFQNSQILKTFKQGKIEMHLTDKGIEFPNVNAYRLNNLFHLVNADFFRMSDLKAEMNTLSNLHLEFENFIEGIQSFVAFKKDILNQAGKFLVILKETNKARKLLTKLKES